MMQDWLGNELNIGDSVVYSSTSTLTGMNLGQLISIEDRKVQIRLWTHSGRAYRSAKIVTLHQGNSAYASVTRYFGNIPGELID